LRTRPGGAATLQAGGWNLSPMRQPLSAEQTVQRSQAASASTLDSVIHKLMLAEQARPSLQQHTLRVLSPQPYSLPLLFLTCRLVQNGEVSAEVAASVRASLQHLQEESPNKGLQLRQLIHEARPQLPPPPRQPTPPPLMWDASGLGTVNAAAAAAGAAPPLKRTAANMQQQGRLPLPSFHDTFFVDNGLGGGGGAAPSLPPPESVEAARRAREARQAKRREKTAAAAPAPVAPAAMVADGVSPRAADAAAATALGTVATAALNARLDALEKEQRSAAMRLQFMNRQHSEMTLKIESLEARNAALVKENERLTGLWRACPLRCAVWLAFCVACVAFSDAVGVCFPLHLVQICRECAGVSGPGAGHLRRLRGAGALRASCGGAACTRPCDMHAALEPPLAARAGSSVHTVALSHRWEETRRSLDDGGQSVPGRLHRRRGRPRLEPRAASADVADAGR
jgi:hypothetical protein